MIRCRDQTFSNSVCGAFIASLCLSDRDQTLPAWPRLMTSDGARGLPPFALVDLLGAGEPHDLAVAVDLGEHELREVLGRAAAGDGGHPCHAGLHLLGLEDGV